VGWRVPDYSILAYPTWGGIELLIGAMSDKRGKSFIFRSSQSQVGGELLKSEEKMDYDALSSILGSLSDTAALKIFNEAAEGFSSGNEVISRLGLTTRKYYRYLQKLRDQGIIAYSGKEYYLTPFGKRLHKLMFNHVSSLLSTDPELLDSFQRVEGPCRLEIIDDYSELAKFLNSLIEKSKYEILLATRYVDLSIAQSLLYALQRGVKVRSVSNDKLNLSSLLALLKDMVRLIRPSSIPSFFNNSDYRAGEVPLSFLIVDNEIAVFEIPTEEFKMSFCTSDKKIILLLSDLFRGLWNKSGKLQIKLNLQKKTKERTE